VQHQLVRQRTNNPILLVMKILLMKFRGCLDFKKCSLITQISSLITYHWKYHNFLRWHVWHLFPTLITQKILFFVRPTDWLGSTFTSYFSIHVGHIWCAPFMMVIYGVHHLRWSHMRATLKQRKKCRTYHNNKTLLKIDQWIRLSNTSETNAVFWHHC